MRTGASCPAKISFVPATIRIPVLARLGRLSKSDNEGGLDGHRSTGEEAYEVGASLIAFLGNMCY